MYNTNYDEDLNKAPSNNRKRVRASQACVHCRKKKIKCDEVKPDCSQCQDANIICEYTEPKKRGPRKGYIQLLEERLAEMERKLMGPSNENSRREKSINSIMPPSQSYSPVQIYDNLDKFTDLPPIDIVNHLVDLFFKYINSVFPFIHRSILKKSIQNGSVSHPLLYSVLAIGARFSEHPSIRTNPPYLAGEQFAKKALSLVNVDTLEPTLENIQFWGIMSCLEYGCASGSKSWIYGGLAIRFCQELGLQKEEVQSTPIFAADGSIDTLAMALRRRVFWSCYGIDKFCSAGTHRTQCIDKKDCDTNFMNIPECLILRDPLFHRNADGIALTEDSLMNITTHYLKVLGHFGEVNKYMNRAKSKSASIVWPPIAEFRNLDMQLRTWQDNLPQLFQFNESNLQYHHQHASSNYLNLWLSSHAMWCSSMMILHRGSLAFADTKSTDMLEDDLLRRIKSSIDVCRTCVDTAMGVFEAIKIHCGYNMLPYLGYSAYVFSTILMTHTFSGTPESCKKSSRGLKMLSELIDGLRPYWPICERLSNATKELLQVHQKLYQSESGAPYLPYLSKKNANEDTTTKNNATPPLPSRSSSSHSTSSLTTSPVNISNTTPDSTPPISTLLGVTTEPSLISSYPAVESPYRTSSMSSTLSTTPYVMSSTTVAQENLSTSKTTNQNNDIDFNSLEFLYDTGLFGQVVFDVNNNSSSDVPIDYSTPYFPNHSLPYTSSATTTSTNTPTASAFQPVIPQQLSKSSFPYNNSSKSLWS